MLETLLDEVVLTEISPKQLELIIQERSLFHRLKNISTMNEENIISLSSEVTQFYTGPYSREQFGLTSNEEYQKYRDTIVTLLMDLLIKKLETLELTKTKAYLIEALFYLTDFSPEIQAEPVEKYIEKIIQLKDAELLKALLQRSLTVGVKVNTAVEQERWKSLKNLSEEDQIKMLPTLIEGVASFSIEWGKGSGFETMLSGNRTIIWALNLLQLNPELLKENPAAYKRITDVADMYTHFFIEVQDTVNSSYPSHNTTQVMIDLLTKLYNNPNESHRETNSDFINFLEKLYAHKVLKFSSGSHLNFLHDWFMKLLKNIGYDPEKFTEEAKAILNK